MWGIPAWGWWLQPILWSLWLALMEGWLALLVLLTACQWLSIIVFLMELYVFKIIISFWHGWICPPFIRQMGKLPHCYVTVGGNLTKGWGNRGSALLISRPTTASSRPSRPESPSDSLLAIFSFLPLNFISGGPEWIGSGRTFLGPAPLMDSSIPSSLLKPARVPPPPRCKSPSCVAAVW